MFWARCFFRTTVSGELLWLPSLCRGKSGSQWLEVHVSPCGQCCVSQPSCHMHLVLRIWWNMGESWSIYFWEYTLDQCRYHRYPKNCVSSDPSTASSALLFRISRAKFGPGSHLTLPRRSLHVQRVQHRKKSAGSCGVLFGCIWLCLKVSSGISWDRPKMDKNGQFFPGKPMISDPAMLFFAAKPSLAYD